MTGRFLSKFAVKWILKIPLHLPYVATLPCETLMSAKQAVNSKLQGSVATYLRCGGVVNNQIKKGLLLSVWKLFLNRWIFGRVTSKSAVVSCTLRAWPMHCYETKKVTRHECMAPLFWPTLYIATLYNLKLKIYSLCSESSFLRQIVVDCILANVHNAKSCVLNIFHQLQCRSLVCHSLIAVLITQLLKLSCCSSAHCCSSSTSLVWSL